MGFKATYSSCVLPARLGLIAFTAAVALSATAAHAGTVTVYSNVTTFSGEAYNPGGATAQINVTDAVLDDINAGAGLAGTPVNSITFSVANLNSLARSVDPIIAVYGSNASNDGPGAILYEVSFSAVTLAGDTDDLYTYTSTSALFDTPSGTFYIGEAFSNQGISTTSIAQLNKFGLGLYNPPTVGSSSDEFFQTAGPGFVTAGGSFGNFDGDPVANFGFALSDTLVAATPEPGSLSLLALGLASMGGLVRRFSRKA